MNDRQLMLLELIKAAIENGPVNKEIFMNADWEALYNESLAHNITTFLFPTIDRLHKEGAVPDEVYEKIRKLALITGFKYEQTIYSFSTILNELQEAGIPVLLFKGVVLRNIYPYPEYRTMGDFDILVHKEHMDKVYDILLKYGYTCETKAGIHWIFTNPQMIDIEVHWTLTKEFYIKSTEYLEEDVWTKTMPFSVCGAPALTLKQEEHLVYLLLHMAGHFISSGSGLRQIIDVAVFAKLIYKTADWDYVYDLTNQCSLHRFSRAVFYVCSKYFGIAFPEKLSDFKDEETCYFDGFVDDVLRSGTFGRRTKIGRMRSGLKRNQDQIKYSGQFVSYINKLFPPISKISDTYKILNKYPGLLPFVWIYRINEPLFNGRLTIWDTLVQPSEYKRRALLIEWMKIK